MLCHKPQRYEYHDNDKTFGGGKQYAMQTIRLRHIYRGDGHRYPFGNPASRMDVFLDNLRIACIDLLNLKY